MQTLPEGVLDHSGQAPTSPRRNLSGLGKQVVVNVDRRPHAPEHQDIASICQAPGVGPVTSVVGVLGILRPMASTPPGLGRDPRWARPALACRSSHRDGGRAGCAPIWPPRRRRWARVRGGGAAGRGARVGWRVLIGSTPWRGSGHFFHDLWRQGMDAPGVEVASWHWPSTANPHVDVAWLEAVRGRSNPDYFAREYLAEWTDEAGAYFSTGELMAAVADYELTSPADARFEASFGGPRWPVAGGSTGGWRGIRTWWCCWGCLRTWG